MACYAQGISYTHAFVLYEKVPIYIPRNPSPLTTAGRGGRRCGSFVIRSLGLVPSLRDKTHLWPEGSNNIVNLCGWRPTLALASTLLRARGQTALLRPRSTLKTTVIRPNASSFQQMCGSDALNPTFSLPTSLLISWEPPHGVASPVVPIPLNRMTGSQERPNLRKRLRARAMGVSRPHPLSRLPTWTNISND